MAEIIEGPSALSKIIPVSFKINDTDSVTTTRLATKKQFNTTDTDAWLSFILDVDGIDASMTGEFDITMVNVDEDPSSIINRTNLPFSAIPFHYKIDASADVEKNQIRHAGRWIGQVIIRLANGDTTTRQFDFAIVGHLLDGKEARLILIEDYNALMATISESKQALDQYNVDYAALLADITDAEALRVQEYNTLLAAQQANIDAFDVALDTGIVAANLATKLQTFEATNNSRLLSAERQLVEVEAQVDLLNRGLGETMPTMASLLAAYPTGDTRDHIVAGNIAEVDTLTVTGVPTAAGNIIITLNGVAKTVAVDPAVQTTTALVATAIRAEVYTGWTTGGTGSVVTFTATTVGTRTAPTFSGETTGTTGTFVRTAIGEAANFHRYFWNGTAWTDGGAYQAIELVDGIVTESKTSFFKPGKNLFDGVSYSGYINTSGVFGASGTYVYLNRIKTKGLSSVIWSGLSGNGVTRTGRTARFVTAYDVNNNVLTAYSMQNVSQYTVPDPIVAYVILTFGTSSFSASSFQIESGTEITNYEYYYNKIAPEYLLFSKTEFLKRKLQGKKVAIFGDSIMWGAGSSGVALGELLAQKYGMIVYKYAISGAVMGQFPAKSHIADQVSTAIATGIVFDFIFFNGGTNDSYETDNVPKCPLGVITTDYTSVLDETAFSGGFEKVAKLLCDSFPYAVKAYVRPHNMASRPYDNQITYGENGLKICDKWGFGYIDMYKTMNTWLSYYQTKYLSDSTHPNLVGYTDKYLPETEKFIFDTLFN